MLKKISIDTDLLFATPLSSGDGYTWTLASRLGAMLRKAEDRFGPRDKSYTILGVEFGGDVPQIWYPGNCRNIVIQLTPNCTDDLIRACYQLAHECVHLLAPTGGQNANNLEEGLATQFSHEYVEENFNIRYDAGVKAYEQARKVVARLLATNPDCIRNIRKGNPELSKIIPDQILDEVPTASRQDVEYLCQPFRRSV